MVDEKKEEKKWKKYSLIRNYYKYLGAYLATKYVMSDEKTKKELDKKYSQQKKQRESWYYYDNENIENL